jgi:hypothetical protein
MNGRVVGAPPAAAHGATAALGADICKRASASLMPSLWVAYMSSKYQTEVGKKRKNF